MRKLSIYDCIKIAESKNGRCLSLEYPGNRIKMLWECEKHHKWEAVFGHIKNGSWCRRCSALENNKKRTNAITIDDVLNFVSSKGWKCHTKIYINNDQLLHLECENGHKWDAPFKRIKNQKTDCPYCAKKHQFTPNEINEMINKSGNKVVCLTKTIKKSKEQSEWQCLEHNHNFKMPLFRMIDNNFECSICMKEFKIKYIWKDVLNACEKTNLIFLNCPNDIIKKIYNTKNIDNEWIFKCTCDKLVYPNIHNVIVGRNKSCGCIKSRPQREVFDFIQELGFGVIENDNSLIRSEKKFLELDIYIPEKNIAIEYCGLYWHGEVHNNINARMKHLNKLKLCQEKGIRLITIFEDEWLLKPEQTKGYLKAILSKTEIKIDARKCELKPILNSIARGFHNNNHIQGNSNGKSIGLYFNNELICVATFAKPSASRNSTKNNENKIELMRYTVKINHSVRGGMGKLLKDFIKNNKNIKEVVSYSDNRWSNGNLYKTLGFKQVNSGSPSYFYFKNGSIEKYHRFNFTKKKALKLFGGDPLNETEWSIMSKNGYDRIWDCGSSKWILSVNNE